MAKQCCYYQKCRKYKCKNCFKKSMFVKKKKQKNYRQFMPEMHLKQPGFTYSACSPFTKNKEFKNL